MGGSCVVLGATFVMLVAMASTSASAAGSEPRRLRRSRRYQPGPGASQTIVSSGALVPGTDSEAIVG